MSNGLDLDPDQPECDNVLQPEPRSGEGCNTLSHEGLANVNIRKRMLYRHCYIPSFQAQAVQIILFNCMQKCPP